MNIRGAIRVPSRLSGRVHEHFGDVDALEPGALVARAAQVTQQLLASAGTAREVALDLLAVDAVVTSAMERWSASPEELDANCLTAMHSLAQTLDDA